MRAVAAFWRSYAAAMAEHQMLLWLSLIYFVAIGPTWLTARLSGKKFVRVGWIERPPATATVADMRRLG
jgi:hypothetical protein